MTHCPECGHTTIGPSTNALAYNEEIDDAAFKKGECAKCKAEIAYGLNGCGG